MRAYPVRRQHLVDFDEDVMTTLELDVETHQPIEQVVDALRLEVRLHRLVEGG